jgi:Skp family chaperone for outer membrane proteins
MKLTAKATAAMILAASLVISYAHASDAKPPVKKSATKKAAPPAGPSIQDEIETMRRQLQGEIDSLKTNLADRDAQLRKAQADAAAAQAAAAKAQADADAQKMADEQNNTSVSALKSTVDDLKANEVSLAATVTDETSAIKKSLLAPDTMHYKGIAITPGGFAAGETVWRTKATGGDIPTAFSAIPFEGADAYSLSEFYGDGRQSRLSLMAEGKISWATIRGYYEADFLGTGITSNNNQSNSYVLRQRVVWAQAALHNGVAITGGQLWSLATEDKKAISNLSGDIMTPQTIDPNYVVGFVWTRQYGFRVTKTWNKFAMGIAAENPQVLYSATLSGDTPYAILGSAGQNGGNFNAAISTVGATTYVKSYANVNVTSTGGVTVPTYVPTYATITANSNITNISFNYAPDMIVKFTADPAWGHYELIGIGRFAHELVFNNVTQNTVKYGGVTDIQGNNGSAPGTKIASSTTAASYNNTISLGGIAGSLRVPLSNVVTFGVKGLYGPGVGRYGATTLSDVTNDGTGELKPIHNTSGLVTLEATPSPRLSLYLNYGIDYAARADYATNSLTLKDPTPTFCMAGTTAANAATNCSASPTAAMFAAGGSWGSHFTATPVISPIGYGSRYASISASCAAQAIPGYASGSVGYTGIAGSGCGNNTRSVQEITGGYWYDLYRGDKGRLRQAIQYGYVVREGWSGSSTTGALSTPLIGAKGIDNMFWTSFRYYLP